MPTIPLKYRLPNSWPELRQSAGYRKRERQQLQNALTENSLTMIGGSSALEATDHLVRTVEEYFPEHRAQILYIELQPG